MAGSPERRNPRQDRSRARVEAILDAAGDVLRESSVEAMTMSGVAARAGSSIASVYRYFPDRTSLLRTLAERYLDDVHDAIGAELEGSRTRDGAREALSAVLRSYHRAVLDDRALRQLWAGTLSDPVLAELSVADNLRNGRLIARHLAPFSPLEPGRLEVCCVLLANLAGAAVSLAVDVGGACGDAYVAEFERCFDLVLGPS